MRAIRFLAAAAVVGVGCAGPPAPPPPALSLQGQLVTGTVLTPPGAISLAVAWYPAWYGGTPGGPAKAVVVQPATFEGSFPLDFTFHAEGPPPAEAMVDLTRKGGTGQAAFGVLIAFRDGNGNGALDIATADTPSPDRIVGVSLPDPSLPPPPHSWFVAYLDGKPASTDLLGAYTLEQGYNLIQRHGDYGSEPVPASTPIELRLTNTDALGYFACADANFDYMTPIACGIDPYDGKYRLDGILFGFGPSQLRVLDGHGARADGTLTYNGEVVPYDPAPLESFEVNSVPGVNTMQIEVPGFSAETITTNIPGPVHLTAPVPATLRSGAYIDLSWDADPAVELYDVIVHNDLFDEETGSGWLGHQLTTGTSARIGPIRYTGTATVFVMALGPLAVGSNGSYLTPLNRFYTSVEFTAP